jgi:uncharacterized membrane protein YbhN (UPF0104 family)
VNRSNLLAIVLVLLLFVLILFAFRGEAPRILRLIRGFPWPYFLIACLLALLNYLIRFLRWEFLLRRTCPGPARSVSLLVFFSGLAMSISPGKLGEVLKAGLLRELSGVPLRRSAPVVVVERLGDLIGVVLLAAIGLPAYRGGVHLVLPALLIVVGVLALVYWERLWRGVLSGVERLPVLGRSAGALLDAYRSGRSLLTPSSLTVVIPLSVAAWFPECLALWVVLRGLGIDLSLLPTTFIYATATLAGAVSFLPGGLGATEGSLAGLLMLRHVPGDAALAATLLVRAATLWFAVALGLAALALTRLLVLRRAAAPLSVIERGAREGLPGEETQKRLQP